MADLSKIPPKLLPLSRRIPEKIMDRLTDEEAQARCERASKLEAEANRSSAGGYRDRTLAWANRVLNAEPAMDAKIAKGAADAELTPALRDRYIAAMRKIEEK